MTNVKVVQSNPSFPCIHKNRFELRLRHDFTYKEEEEDIDICETLDEALAKQKLKGIAYWQTDGTIEMAKLNQVFAQCPKRRCSGKMFHDEKNTLICEKCGDEYKTCFQHVHLDVDVMVGNTIHQMVSSGSATFDLLKMDSATFTYMNHYKTDEVASSIASLKKQKFSFLVKVSSETTYIIESAKLVSTSKRENADDSDSDSEHITKRLRRNNK